jgi:hypothetical protein
VIGRILTWITGNWVEIDMQYERPGLDWHGVRESGIRLTWSTRECV